MAEETEWIADALQRYERRLVRYVAQLLGGDADAARDVVQDCFVNLCRQPPCAGQGDGLRARLFRSCRNGAIDHLRRNRRVEAMETIEIECGERGPSQALEHGEAEGRVQARLQALPARQQEVVRLKFQDGLSYGEIATTTGLSVSNVGFLLHRAMRALRAQLQRSER